VNRMYDRDLTITLGLGPAIGCKGHATPSVPDTNVLSMGREISPCDEEDNQNPKACS
jgi:hypothetical protein